jgi:hypothetical protein
MGKWDNVVSRCAKGILTARLLNTKDGVRPSKEDIDDVIFDHEKIVVETLAASLQETPTDRRRQFQDELKTRLSEMLKDDPDNRKLQEALALLGNDRARRPEHRLPSEDAASH